MAENRELVDFEDTIRLDSMTMPEALLLKSNTIHDVFVIGEKIGDYLPSLRSLGFKDLWQDSSKGDESKILALSKTRKYKNSRSEDSKLMNAYVDYVLEHTDSELMVFLPPTSGIIAAKEVSDRPTYDEIIRTLKLFPKHSERIHFVTGLFGVKPKDLK